MSVLRNPTPTTPPPTWEAWCAICDARRDAWLAHIKTHPGPVCVHVLVTVTMKAEGSRRTICRVATCALCEWSRIIDKTTDKTNPT